MIVRLSVPQRAGEITVRHAGDDPVTYEVKKGVVEVRPEHAGYLLMSIEGAKFIEEAPST